MNLSDTTSLGYTYLHGDFPDRIYDSFADPSNERSFGTNVSLLIQSVDMGLAGGTRIHVEIQIKSTVVLTTEVIGGETRWRDTRCR
ncbi:hypothetical protein Pla22_05770 [Rubripirellula amarantea]|uniref:Uncharacterized protein n=1 Tax=Rubripirellula amarantea TaxID=2527999 RepID=A0A5C5WS04_9BACT|nr:hypothetical protein [Rubripirellula amarantea]TWT52949.1 hypothetical protein Pla22_05770 [Rubripirellula amarantea]